jgi:ubiquinone/menaquinone biosynthesis C-methylase UbiE
MDNNTDETQQFWNRIAADWDIQVGDEGDSNRILNSDPVLWQFAGDVSGRTVLDAGCGTGYLARKLHERGAHVIGVDFSEDMIRIACSKPVPIDYRVDSCSELKTVQDESVDLIVANYVLMDTPDLVGTMSAFFRVLRPEGSVVAVFSHPCFPAGRATVADDGGITYQWPFPYFQQQKCIDPPWGHFTSEFIWFHRPLSDYWKAFVGAGFRVVDFEEPRIMPDRYHLAGTQRKLQNSKSRPFSVAFKLQKPEGQNQPSDRTR